MVFAPVFASFFQGDDIAGVGDDTEGLRVTIGSAANVADGLGGEVEANAALADLLLGIEQRFG